MDNSCLSSYLQPEMMSQIQNGTLEKNSINKIFYIGHNAMCTISNVYTVLHYGHIVSDILQP